MGTTNEDTGISIAGFEELPKVNVTLRLQCERAQGTSQPYSLLLMTPTESAMASAMAGGIYDMPVPESMIERAKRFTASRWIAPSSPTRLTPSISAAQSWCVLFNCGAGRMGTVTKSPWYVKVSMPSKIILLVLELVELRQRLKARLAITACSCMVSRRLGAANHTPISDNSYSL